MDRCVGDDAGADAGEWHNMNRWLGGGLVAGLAAAGSVALALPGSAQDDLLEATMETPVIAPLDEAVFSSVDPCFDPSVEVPDPEPPEDPEETTPPEEGEGEDGDGGGGETPDPQLLQEPPTDPVPGRVTVDVTFGGEVVFSFEELAGEDGHWTLSVFMVEEGTEIRAPFDVGEYGIQASCVPVDADEPGIGYTPLTFTVQEDAPEPPPADPTPGLPTPPTG
jgi:hypothetical protein